MGLSREVLLCQLAAHLREYRVGVTSDQPYRANHDHQDHRQHHRVFGNVLSVFFSPQLTDSVDHGISDLFHEAGSLPTKTQIRTRVPLRYC